MWALDIIGVIDNLLAFVMLAGVKPVLCCVLGGSRVRGAMGSTLKRYGSQPALGQPSATKQR